MERSKKYSNYTDDKLIESFRSDTLTGDNKHFLYVELIFRNLLEKAEQQKKHTKISKPISIKKVLIFGAGAALLLMQVLQRMF